MYSPAGRFPRVPYLLLRHTSLIMPSLVSGSTRGMLPVSGSPLGLPLITSNKKRMSWRLLMGLLIWIPPLWSWIGLGILPISPPLCVGCGFFLIESYSKSARSLETQMAWKLGGLTGSGAREVCDDVLDSPLHIQGASYARFSPSDACSSAAATGRPVPAMQTLCRNSFRDPRTFKCELMSLVLSSGKDCQTPSGVAGRVDGFKHLWFIHGVTLLSVSVEDKPEQGESRTD